MPPSSANRAAFFTSSTPARKRRARSIDRLLDISDTQLTITVGRDAELKAKLMERTREYGDRVRIFGWTNQMPQLMLSSHLVIGKAGGACVQEAIAARCPMIVNQVIPGQEEGNARLITEYGLGAVAERNREVPDLVKEAFAHKARLWQEWRRNLAKISRPDAALRLAELVLAECEASDPTRKHIKLFALAGETAAAPLRPRRVGSANAAVRFSHPHELFRRQAVRARGGGFLRAAGFRLHLHHRPSGRPAAA